jgi:hypothetical protein
MNGESNALRRLHLAAVLAASAILGAALGQTYYRGGQCVSSANCANCLTAVSVGEHPEVCPDPPHIVCLTMMGDEAGATFSWCVQHNDSNSQCKMVALEEPTPIRCTDMEVWFCDCLENDRCETFHCGCKSTEPDGDGWDLIVDSVCVSA